VSQAGTLSEAMERLAQHRAEQRALQAKEEKVEVKKRRVTLKLSDERDQKLEKIAQNRGMDISTLIKEIVEQWLASQP
jgi:predicted DNA binding CopG/RHH family protein